MNYIGSKKKLSAFILECVREVVGNDLTEMDFCDLFAGTGIVGRTFKPLVRSVTGNDTEYYSYVLNQNYIVNHKPLPRAEFLVAELNALPPQSGFIYQEYSQGGSGGRMYFSGDNGRKIDAVRTKIEEWHLTHYIDDREYYFLLCSLLESADAVANTASVYGAYLKKIKASAANPLVIAPAYFTVNDHEHRVFSMDANELIERIHGDILYLDPPYNTRQYGANYHLLNTIASYKPFSPKGKTGLPQYTKSLYCSRTQVAVAFEDLIRKAQFRYIFLSYNNEGLLSSDTIRTIMSRYGKYSLFSTDYQRFKADSSTHRAHKAKATVEFLHVLIKPEA